MFDVEMMPIFLLHHSETQPFSEEPEFYFEDFIHGSSVAGQWNGRVTTIVL